MDYKESRIAFYRKLIRRIKDDDFDDDDNDEVQIQDDESDDDSSNNHPVARPPVVTYGPGRSFVGNRELGLLFAMVGLKPFGMHKHSSMLLIRERLSNAFKECVPTKAIWKYITSHWDPLAADKIEFDDMKIEKKAFELPKDEEWLKIIEEQKNIINKKDKDDINQATTSCVDIKMMKSVKVMVEKLDSTSPLLSGMKCNKILDCEKTLQNELIDYQTNCTSSNSNVGVKRELCDNVDSGTHSVEVKLSDNVDLGADGVEVKLCDNVDLGADGVEVKLCDNVDLGADGVEVKLCDNVDLGADGVEENSVTMLI